MQGMKERNSLWEKPEAQTHFLALWQDLVQELKGYSTSDVAYEIMNERLLQIMRTGINWLRKNLFVALSG